MKRIVICCDGTWNRLDAANPTNVVQLAEAVAPTAVDGIKQIVWYDEGVGSGNTTVARGLDRILGGAFGAGLTTKIEQAYRFLIFNYEPGDEIYIFGFSRGAYTARSLAGLIRNCGIVEQSRARSIRRAIDLYRGRGRESHPDADDSCRLRFELCPSLYLGAKDVAWRRSFDPSYDPASATLLRIRYLGVWDTVGALGLPNYLWLAGLFNKSVRFHDADLSSSVLAARHAVALDEYRRPYEPSLWNNLDTLNEAAASEGRAVPYSQQWFPGDHSSIGGGRHEAGLAAGALLWLADGAARAGLSLDQTAVARAHAGADHRAPLRSGVTRRLNPMRLLGERARGGPRILADVSRSASMRWYEPANALPERTAYRPPALMRLRRHLGGDDAE